MIHPQIQGQGAEVRYLCPTCSGEGWFSGQGEDVECPGCEGHRVVDADRARELHDQRRIDQRDVSSRVIERRLAAEGARQYDPDEGEAAEVPELARAEALLALRSKLRAAEAVQADFVSRGSPHRWPVALTIEEARALLTEREAA